MPAASLSNVEIFRAGTHLSAAGDKITVTAADLAEMAAGYDVAVHEAPAVIGHPKADAPAYGWVSCLKVDGDRLLADFGEVDPGLVDIIQAGRFKKRSASLWPPKAPGNPTPGKWGLRHVGWLGAQPPAVKGLKAVSFAEDDGGALDFSSPGPSPWIIRGIARLLGALRDDLVERKGAEAAASLMPDWELQALSDEAARMEAAGASPLQSFSEPDPTQTQTTETEEPDMTQTAAELEAVRAQLDRDRAEFAEQQATARRKADALTIDDLVKAGRLPKGEKAGALAFMEAIAEGGAYDFAEAEGGKINPRAWFTGFLSRLPDRVDFSERAAADDTAGAVDFAAPAGMEVDAAQLETHRKAEAYAKANNVPYLAAVKAVS